MSTRIVQMLETYRRRLHKETGKQQPLIKDSSFISAKEAMAASEIGLPFCHYLDPSVPKPTHPNHSVQTPARPKELAATDPLAAADWDGKLTSTGIGYLVTMDALGLFIGGENKSRAKIEKALKQLV
ncbi:hypothetical protein BDV29DRAFT_155202 [Aspergillus leporis]|uniref:Uncharacterized protein n=1 Tax=Aspergillus leporis TaxID=41062 RepID=A0A5N5X5L9_9EURO|nr:hypothetical protein BDV29DRAFT_155202 [Aspergillus leporis]